MSSKKLHHDYHVCVVDIGSPKLGNIGWCFIDSVTGHIEKGGYLDDLIPHISHGLKARGMILGLEAPLFVPLREDLMLATKARKGEGRRPWSAGAGAQVLAMNLPIMTYLFRQIGKACEKVDFKVNEGIFDALPNQIMLFEALVSGIDKGTDHIDDASIMAHYCIDFSRKKSLPPSILEEEAGTDYLNLVAASLLKCGLSDDLESLHHSSPIYKPSDTVL